MGVTWALVTRKSLDKQVEGLDGDPSGSPDDNRLEDALGHQAIDHSAAQGEHFCGLFDGQEQLVHHPHSASSS
jgi:hypothetical protein